MNPPSKQDATFVDAFRESITHELDDAIRKVGHCVGQLSEDQLWWRTDESMNSIANLILHLCGNLRQWVVAGLDGSSDRRNRPQEFAQRDRIPAEHLLKMLAAVAEEAKQTLNATSTDDLVRRRQIQGFEVSGVQAVIDSIAHFRGHTQEITYMTRVQLGDQYQFDFVPRPDQQGGEAN